LNQRVGIVVPTLGNRPDYLEQCLSSIRAAGEAHILLVAPAAFKSDALRSAGLLDSVVIDAGGGLAAAINQGIRALPSTVEFVNWLGDDDLLTDSSIVASSKALDENIKPLWYLVPVTTSMARVKLVWANSSGQWAVPLLRFGPDLIPQPGALFRRSAFEKVGGLRTDLGWAFDFDLFIRLSKVGKLRFLNQTLAKFRWHPESLSVEHRKKSVAEASQVRVSHSTSLSKAFFIYLGIPSAASYPYSWEAGHRYSSSRRPKPSEDLCRRSQRILLALRLFEPSRPKESTLGSVEPEPN
jgi:GT2 family glycosyltransferase